MANNAVHDVKDMDDFNKCLKDAGSKLVVVDFYATWCGPCKRISPVVEKIASEFPNIVFLKVDVEKHRDIKTIYNVTSMPTFVFIKASNKVTQFSGAHENKLRETIAANN